MKRIRCSMVRGGPGGTLARLVLRGREPGLDRLDLRERCMSIDTRRCAGNVCECLWRWRSSTVDWIGTTVTFIRKNGVGRTCKAYGQTDDPGPLSESVRRE